MDNPKTQIFEKLAKIELLISDIYMRFSEAFEEDKEFWWRLAIEERGHASLIRAGCETFEPMNLFPKELMDIPAEILDKDVAGKEETLSKLSEKPCPLSREQALKAAIEIEENDVERRFQLLMERASDSKSLKLFQTLNKDTQDHARRIWERLNSIA